MIEETVTTVRRLPVDRPHVIARGQVTERGLMVDAEGGPAGVVELGVVTWETGDARPSGHPLPVDPLII
ncbi:hypothetical protein [Actinomadura rugatobispora]|uniref:Uncharacterized protein n=1 Tax=Actinomadura rugatobispora TaxID=1994 RepID=A0ABW1AFQ9_9ACTN|nr:hypothetical protein GCM10010200_072370 [Actinomadura rugatobispora]